MRHSGSEVFRSRDRSAAFLLRIIRSLAPGNVAAADASVCLDLSAIEAVSGDSSVRQLHPLTARVGLTFDGASALTSV